MLLFLHTAGFPTNPNGADHSRAHFRRAREVELLLGRLMNNRDWPCNSRKCYSILRLGGGSSSGNACHFLSWDICAHARRTKWKGRTARPSFLAPSTHFLKMLTRIVKILLTSTSHGDTPLPPPYPPPSLLSNMAPPSMHCYVIYRCTVCDTRSTKTFTKHSYEKGVVIIVCPECKNMHLVADNLGWYVTFCLARLPHPTVHSNYI